MNDRALKEFCSKVCFICPPSMPYLPTYHHFTQESMSSIDMFLMHKDSKHAESQVKIESTDATNTGPHDPVLIDLLFIPSASIPESGNKKKVQGRVNWAKVDPACMKS